MKIGYRWFINFGGRAYEPQERTYPTVKAVIEGMADYLRNSDIPATACGIDKVKDDDGCIEVVKRMLTPSQTYYED